MLLLNYIFKLQLDAPTPWGLFFQDSASPQMEGIEELHNNIMFYLAIIIVYCNMNDNFNNKKFFS